MLQRLLQFARLIPRLGVCNILAVIHYRRRLRRGDFERLLPASGVDQPVPLWRGDAHAAPMRDITAPLRAAILITADALVRGEFQRFGGAVVDEGEYPAWFKGSYAATSAQHWSKVAVNAVPGDDVKCTWDLSRFHWAPRLALAAAASGGEQRSVYLMRLQHLTTDWIAKNGYQRGVNWACSHEVSVRGMQLMATSLLLHTQLGMAPSVSLLRLVEESWRRVMAVQSYARAQQNNHSLAEHLFLIYAAAFLAQHGVRVAPEATLAKLHRGLLPMMHRLILPDGGTCMYSTNYHRVFCDMVAFAKIFDDAYRVGLFVQPMLRQRVEKLAACLAAMIEPVSGNIPLIGNNDGSLHAVQYAPFHQAEPSLLLLTAVFDMAAPLRAQRSVDATWLFGYTPRFDAVPPAASHTYMFDAMGLIIIDRPAYRAYLKYPRNQFRPAQQDFFHLDLWIGGVNILTDSGTYSYNADAPGRDDGMGEPIAHNAPMAMHPTKIAKISPFLYAHWPQAVVKRLAQNEFRLTARLAGGYTLERQLVWSDQQLTLSDRVIGSNDWCVVMNGVMAQTNSDTVLQLADRASARLANVKSISLTSTMRAKNYQHMVQSQRAVMRPLQSSQPVVTVFDVVEH